ncbi:hypothetical protein B0T24DRAFT_537298 [Lasiosphaeria ovina]|uniref:RRM domain-containing protein n=1 Tax=Lasiosphaeria ovina TaxID=92902 RepID=A0AAE0JUY9_9PEZI|nr:hypothetical protein B0T24DRAFT_537298 [Lasiosphaeria ovina]
MKSIEKCLENPINDNRNVYIRGLSLKTDDELLLHYVSRFGKVEQSKAIIDTLTGVCKGFGFAKFADVRDSGKCICGFYYLGYEVSFIILRLFRCATLTNRLDSGLVRSAKRSSRHTTELSLAMRA